jgi:hypothetical protein
MSATERTARQAAESDYTALRRLVAELAHGNSGRVDIFDIASTGFHSGWFEYMPDAHSGMVRIVFAGFKPRERAPGLLLRALNSFLSEKPHAAATKLHAVLERVATRDTSKVDVFKLPEGGFRGLVEYMPQASNVMARITIQGIAERARVETLLLRGLEDLVGSTSR